MAAAGSTSEQRAVFAGGSTTAYNYNGEGYDGTPAEPSAATFAFDFGRNRWLDLGPKPHPTMDHRGLVEAGGTFYTLGGMGKGQQVIGNMNSFTLPRGKAP